jgi:N utilization substance protein B
MRRRGRECALQILYQMDVSGSLSAEKTLTQEDLEMALNTYWHSFETVKPKVREFSERLVKGVSEHLAQLDDAISGQSKNWKISRMDRVDLNLLRLAAYEIIYCPDVPKAAAINEALEIAKRFSEDDAASFINGILDNLNG